jgi:hypothetical protein
LDFGITGLREPLKIQSIVIPAQGKALLLVAHHFRKKQGRESGPNAQHLNHVQLNQALGRTLCAAWIPAFEGMMSFIGETP